MSQNDKIEITQHLANEQTFLAWLRTGIEVMAFGFVAIKFNLFASQVMGIVLVGVGTAMIFLAYIRYRTTLRQLRKGEVRYSPLLLTITAVAVLAVSVFLLFCLIEVYISEEPAKIVQEPAGKTSGHP